MATVIRFIPTLYGETAKSNRRNIVSLILFAVLAMMGCTGNGDASNDPQGADTIYTEAKAMSIHHTEPERALVMIDSAVIVGNITWQRGEYLKAVTQYGGFNNKPQAREICLDLLARKDALKDSLAIKQTYFLLTSIEYTSCNFPAVIRYATEGSRLAHSLNMPDEAATMEGYIAHAMDQIGRTDEGVERLRAVITELCKLDTYRGMVNYQTTAKKLLHILLSRWRFAEMVPVCDEMLKRIDELEAHPERFSGIQEGFDIAEYVDFARGQALAFLTTAYARQATANASNPSLHAQFLAKAHETDAKMRSTKWSHSLDCDKMITAALHHMGEFQRFDEAMQRVNAARTDTITDNYVIALQMQSDAASMRGRTKEALAFQQRASTIRDSLDSRNLKNQLAEQATLYHLQEEQLARQQAEADARFFRWITVAIVIALIIALAFAVYFFYKRRETLHKNRALAQQIAETLAYKDKYDAEQKPQSLPENPAALSDADLFQFLRDAILRDCLYLDPQLDRQALVDRFGLSKERIGSAFAKGSTYKSLIDFLADCRLPHAAKLLADRPDLSIADVARESGFPSADTFSRNFRQKYALTPSQFREQQAADT